MVDYDDDEDGQQQLTANSRKNKRLQLSAVTGTKPPLPLTNRICDDKDTAGLVMVKDTGRFYTDTGGRVFTDDLGFLCTVSCDLCGKVMLKTGNVSKHFRLKHPHQEHLTTPKRTTWHK